MADSSAPRMMIVAGPPGAGKSFNADDRAAELNGGSYLRIPGHVRQQVNREFEAFIAAHIHARKSFAFETTLRSPITFEQAERAKAAGFRVEMRFLALETFAMHLMRVKSRADQGGHSAPCVSRGDSGPLHTLGGGMAVRPPWMLV